MVVLMLVLIPQVGTRLSPVLMLEIGQFTSSSFKGLRYRNKCQPVPINSRVTITLLGHHTKPAEQALFFVFFQASGGKRE